MPPGTLQLKSAIDRALCLDPNIEQSRAVVARTEAILQEQQSASRPTLQAVVPASASTQREDSRSANTTSASASLNLQYLWLDGGARRERLNQRTLELEAAKQDLTVQTQTVVLDFVTLWADALDALSVADAANAALASAKASLASAQSRLQAGAGTRVDVLSAQSAAAQADRDLLVAQISARQKLRTLAQRLELDVQALSALEPATQTILVPSWAGADTHAALDSHPQLSAQQQRVTAAQAAYEATKAEGGYTVNVSAQAGPSWSRSNAVTPTTVTTNRLGSEVGLTLTVPLSDGGARKARAGQAKALLDGERAQLASVQRQLSETLESSRSDWDSARADLDSSKVALEAAVLAEKAQRARFEVGLGTITELLTAQNDVATRTRQLSNAQHKLLRTAARLAQARGVLHEPFITTSVVPAAPAPHR
ncbi:MAG: TolC family protein [Burkholderiaceae bacterium]